MFKKRKKVTKIKNVKKFFYIYGTNQRKRLHRTRWTMRPTPCLKTNRHWLGMLQLWGPPTELDSFWQIYRRKSKLPRRHLLFCFRWLMSLHYLGKHKPQELRTQRTRNHDQIFTWLQLNHASLLVSQYRSKMLYATKHAVDAVRWATQFISEQHNGTLSSVQLLQRKTSFLPKLRPQQPRDGHSDDSTRFMESYSTVNTSCKSEILKKSSSNSGKPLTRQFWKARDFRVIVFPDVEQRH